MSDPAAAKLDGARETGGLESLFEGLSGILRDDLWPAGAHELLENLGDTRLRQRLAAFVRNIGRIPRSAHGRLGVALNRDQIPSKLWLIEHLSRTMALRDSHVLVIGGWYGIFPLLLECLYPDSRIEKHVIDLDPAACDVAGFLLDGVVTNVTIECKNASAVDYSAVRRDPSSVVINTICEHMSDFRDWFGLIPRGQLVALQSNDHRGCCEHTNCVDSLEDFESQAPLSQVNFRGTLPLANFRRFMLLGVR